VHLTLGQQGRTLLPEDTPRSKGSDKKAGEKADSDPGKTNQSAQSAEAGQTAEAESKHRDSRKPRERGLSQRGRGSWSGDRPPAVLWVERGGEGRVLELQPDVTQKTLVRSAVRHVEPGSRIDTDDFSGYGLLEGAYDHRSVDHEETYVIEDDVHCNTAEGEWSIFKPWWRGFRGVAKRHAYRYLSEYSFRRSHRSDSRQRRLHRMVALLNPSTGGSSEGRFYTGLH